MTLGFIGIGIRKSEFVAMTPCSEMNFMLRSPSVASSTESVFSQASYTSPNSLNSPISPATVNSPNSPASVSTPNSPVRPPRKNRPGLSGSDTHSLNSRNSSIETW